MVVIATGPSLSKYQVAHIEGSRKQNRCRVIAVSDAHRMAPFADLLYSCDVAWWMHHAGVMEYGGRKFCLHVPANVTDPWTAAQREWKTTQVLNGYEVTAVPYVPKDGFSFTPGVIHDGKNSGFQAINLALQTGSKRIILVGFDMQEKDGKRHFFGKHPDQLPKVADFSRFIKQFNKTLHSLNQAGATVINCTPDSALTCYQTDSLLDALSMSDVFAKLITKVQGIESRRAIEHDKYRVAYGDLPNYRMGAQRMADAQHDLTNALVIGGNYLDVGCGRGEMVDFAESIGFRHVQGTEVVQELIDDRHGRVIYAEVHALPFADNLFDVVTMFDVIEHLVPGDDEAACKELQRVAKSTVILTANNQDSFDRGVQLHINKRAYDEWHELFCSWFDGQVIRMDTDRHYPVSPAWRVNL